MTEESFIYLLRSDEVFGPYPVDQFSEMLDGEDILEDDLAALAGTTEWKSPYQALSDAEDAECDRESLSEFIESFAAELQELQEDGIAKRSISEKAKADIIAKVRANPSESQNSLEYILLDHFPKTLTAWGKQEIETRIAERRADEERQQTEYRQRKHLGEFAQPLDLSDFQRERGTKDVTDATQKQIDYLILLGVSDDSLLAGLGKWQASDLIDFVKTKRAEMFPDEESL